MAEQTDVSASQLQRGPLYDMVREEAFYQGLDPGIRFAVRALHAAGIGTGQSCQGGVDHAYDRPTVDLAGTPRHSAEGFAALHVLNEWALPVMDIAYLWNVHHGLPWESFWRITFHKSMEDQADKLPSFVRSTQSQWIEEVIA